MDGVVFLLIQQVLVMFLLMMVGFILFKIKMINPVGVAQMSSIAMYVSTPAVIIKSFLTSYDSLVMQNGLRMVVLTVGSMVILLAVNFTVFRKQSNILKAAAVFGNAGFLGIPLVQMVLGETAVFYMTVFIALCTTVLFTYGIYMVSGDKSTVSAKKIILNPNIIAVVIGLVVYLTQVPFPEPLTKTVSYIAGLNAPLAMMVLGSYMAETDFKAVLSRKETYSITCARLVVAPVLILIFLRFFPSDWYVVKAVCMIANAAPIAGAVGMFTQRFGGDYAYVAGVISFTTLLSLATMPVFLFLLGL